MSKEKFEVAFLAGGLMLNALGTRLRRKATTPSETVGAAMHDLQARLDEHRTALTDPAAAEQRLALLRAELCEPRPDQATVTAHLNELRAQAPTNVAVGEAVTALDDAVDAWLETVHTP
ncbi:MAG TPA: hypothetical protein VE465_20585 [Streptosporangiaceae bacterium]|nr:hypothetical protein [Streptosporangiaceae bacterium]